MITGYDEFSEARYFTDQAGVFEIRKSALSPGSKGMVMSQVGDKCFESYFIVEIYPLNRILYTQMALSLIGCLRAESLLTCIPVKFFLLD